MSRLALALALALASCGETGRSCWGVFVGAVTVTGPPGCSPSLSTTMGSPEAIWTVARVGDVRWALSTGGWSALAEGAAGPVGLSFRWKAARRTAADRGLARTVASEGSVTVRKATDEYLEASVREAEETSYECEGGACGPPPPGSRCEFSAEALGRRLGDGVCGAPP